MTLTAESLPWQETVVYDRYGDAIVEVSCLYEGETFRIQSRLQYQPLNIPGVGLIPALHEKEHIDRIKQGILHGIRMWKKYRA